MRKPRSPLAGSMSGRIPPSSGWNQKTLAECTGDSCPCRRGVPVHPPVLLAFFPELGTYRQAEARCTARWAGTQQGHVAGQICGQQATEQIADMWVCSYHCQRYRDWMKRQPSRDMAADFIAAAAVHEERKRLEQELHQARLRQRREQAALERELAREQIRAEEAVRAQISVVYYAQRQDDAVKIGTTRGLSRRLTTLTGSHGTLRLLAVHSGTYAEEHALHRKFAALRITAKGEWFRPGLALIKHIVMMREQHRSPEGKNLPAMVDLREIRREARRLAEQEDAASWGGHSGEPYPARIRPGSAR